MSSEPVSSNSNMTWTLDPVDNLTAGTTYLTRVTTGVIDAAGNALSSQYDNSTGFTTASSPVSDRWSSSLKGGNIVLSNNNLDATSQNTTHSWNSVYGEKSYSVDD
jgi:CRISPR/Cas system-associated protein Csx1